MKQGRIAYCHPALDDGTDALQRQAATPDPALGGDEFGALLMDTSDGQAVAAIERLKGMTPELGSFSAGVAAWEGVQSLDELLRRADVALYAAKTDGRSRVEIAPPTLEPSEALTKGEIA